MSDSNAQPSRHTPGPWTYHHEPSLNRYAVRAEPFGTETILSISYWSRTPIWDRERAEADASRIVSCVNACDGINPEAVPELVKACEAFLASAASADESVAFTANSLKIINNAVDSIGAALAKAKGGEV